MKKNSILKCLAIASIFLSAATSWAQAVASVPVGCRVVVAGTGGTVGANPIGRVGDGGVVIMPDPSGGGAFNFTVGGVATSASWSLKGDLSNTAVTPSAVNNAPPQPAAGSSANIFTCNKNLRTTSTEASNTNFARSKGQVRVSWSAPPCNNSITFDIFKTFTSIPTIVGPTCLEPLKTYTFSIDQIASDNANDNIGFDKYYWSGIPAGITGLYYSADNSSITFTMGSSVPATSTLRCCVGRYNTTSNADGGNGPNQTLPPANYLTCVNSLPLVPLPTTPLYTTPPPTCHPTGTASFTIVYPNPAPLVYTWTAPNTGWTIGTTTSTSVTINTPNNNPGELVLTISGSTCGSNVVIRHQVNRNLTGSLITPNITSPGSICMTAGSSNNQFFLGNTAAANNVTWTVTSPLAGAAANITLSAVSGQPSSTVAVAIGANAPVNTTYTLTATANTAPFPACTATAVNYTFNVRPQTPTFAGANCVVRGSSVTSISVNPVAGVATNGYTWAPLPAGVTCTANCNTVNPTFLMNGTGNTSLLQVTAAGTSGCNSLVGSKSINYYTVVTTPGPFSDSYAVNGACGIVSSWTVNGVNYTASSGNIGISGAQNNTLTISGSGGAPITQVCANYPGPIVVCATSFGTSTLKQANPNPKNLRENIIIFPNPNDGNFDIQIKEVKESASATVTDMTGKKLGTYELTKGENKIKTKNLSSGTYIIVIDVDGKQESQRLIIK
ncbi:T9SS type A sorting domain-containing protein [Flavobacterium sp. 25HG05S-40]|uniref:T9SS type A sorting domain-containing protein n=1 Tax=Flavobacterium sp. 25HG05S-40 TaxID=3458682 RepID=UPI004044AE8C